MKLDDFTGGVTYDFRDLLEGWAGLATSTIAFLIAPDDVGPFWPRDLRTDQKVPQVLWPGKCKPCVSPGWPAGGGWCSRSSCCPPRYAGDEEGLGGTLPPVEPCLRLPLVSESVPRCEKQTWLAPQPPLWLTLSSLSVQGASSSPAISCPDLSLPSRFGEDGGLGHKGSPTWCVAGDSSLCVNTGVCLSVWCVDLFLACVL